VRLEIGDDRITRCKSFENTTQGLAGFGAVLESFARK
jgi:hypothetical protein